MENKVTHDPGGKSLFPMPDGVIGDAAMSADGLCRFMLTRKFKSADDDAVRHLWIGLNPSMATPDKDDPTVRVEWNLTVKSGDDANNSRSRYPVYVKMNVLPYRATDPASLDKLMMGTYLPEAQRPNHVSMMQSLAAANMMAIVDEAQRADRVIVAWGRPASKLVMWQCMQLLSMLRANYTGVIWCVGLLTDDWPGHSLRRKCVLEPYRVNPKIDGVSMERVLLANVTELAKNVRMKA